MNQKPQVGFVSVYGGFNPLATEDDGRRVNLAAACRMRLMTDRITRCSFPCVRSNDWVTAAREITDATGMGIVPIFMCDESTNASDTATETAAIAHLSGLISFSLKAGATMAMGPSAEPWSPGCTVWGKGTKLSGREKLGLVKQAAKVHAAAFRDVPSSTQFALATEFLFDGEQANFNTLAMSVGLAEATNDILGAKRVTVTIDTAHTYGNRSYTEEELQPIFAQHRKVVEKGLLGLAHLSRPRRRGAHPLKSPAPMVAHMKNLIQAGYRGPWDIEIFNPRDQFLMENLPEFLVTDPGFDEKDPVPVHLEIIELLDGLYAAA